MPNTAANPNPITQATTTCLQVVVAVIHDQQGQVLLAQRPNNKHQGGKWEFPGGKIEQGEAATVALARELREELGIIANTGSMQPLVKVDHHYGDQVVCLDVWQVYQYYGEAYGAEGQAIAWFPLGALRALAFPAANRAILDALGI